MPASREAIDIEDEKATAARIFTGWIATSADAARRRQAVDYRAVQDLQDLWRWLHQERWRPAERSSEAR